jgi:hypothetical protein
MEKPLGLLKDEDASGCRQFGKAGSSDVTEATSVWTAGSVARLTDSLRDCSWY